MREDTAGIGERNGEAVTASVRSELQVAALRVENFRLLKDACLGLEPTVTALVGRNNTGKTSLSDVLKRFCRSRDPGFSIEDFSAEVYSQFHAAFERYLAGDEAGAREVLPQIRLTIDVEYDPELPEFGPLAEFVIDLDPDCHRVRIEFEYVLGDAKLSELFAPCQDASADIELAVLLARIKDQIEVTYRGTVTAVDPMDPTNTKPVDFSAVQRLITIDCLNAQRGLDDEKDRPKDLISQRFHSMFAAAMKAAEESDHRKFALELEDALKEVQKDLGEKVGEAMARLVPALERFGYPGLHGQKLVTSTSLDVKSLLGDHTKVHYDGAAGVQLPESYSGLGSRNLVLILLTLFSFYRAQAARGTTPGIHLVFIEEPEAHLHPQMQEVFIARLGEIRRLYPSLDELPGLWGAQFLVSTHSSHVANRAPFAAIRYFLVESQQEDAVGRRAEILDLRQAHGLDERFLHQYLTLTQSDLFFADKAIFVEGTSERLIVPKAIERTTPRLGQQYVTLLEVGGAHAYKFFPLLDFLQIPALVITDIDPVAQHDGKGQRKKALVCKGERTGNATIKRWFGDKEMTPDRLIEAAETEEVRRPQLYLAYQVPESEGRPCGRSFEEAFILANPDEFELPTSTDRAMAEAASMELAGERVKSEFALTYAIDRQGWQTPRYIQRGLEWLEATPTAAGASEDGTVMG
ncbi:ATP-dependent nuclease [Glycomyces salinus]|uniref:ATP-dependent nuclease n=1 Tax=Glycomyces salinus TaxID=980294 RepID=UPI0018EB4916|nr:AAA family ATPase [Glycomyces salinus]